MKKILLYGSTAAVLMLLASCSTDATEPSAPAVRTITRTFPVNETIGSAHDTRTAYENGQIGFTDNEKLGAYVWDAVQNKNASNVTVATRTPGSPATITVTHDAISGVEAYTYVFVSPYKYNNSPYRTTPTVTLNPVQHPTATTFDPSQDILVSQPITGPAGGNTSPVLNEVVFKRLFTFFRLKINRSNFNGNITLAEGEKIRSVTITAPEGTELAGTAEVKIEEAYDATTFTFTEPSNSITADYGTDGEALNADGTFDVWFVVNPVAFNGLTIEVRTSAQTITQIFSEQVALDFKASGINTLNFQPANNTNITTTTAAVPQDYYEEGVEIEGVTYSKNSESKTNKTASAPNTALSLSSTTLVYFLGDGGNPDNSFYIEAANDGSHTYRENSAIFIGRHADHKTKLVLKNQFHLRNRESGIYAFKNLDIDMRNGSQAQLFTMTNDTGGAKTLIFEDCDITFGNNKSIVAPYSSTKESSYIENIIFRNCRLRYEAGTEGYYALIKLHGDNDKNFLKSGLAGFKTLVLENNVFYSTQGSNVKTAVSILYQRYWEADAASYSLSNLNITCKNNTFIDLISFSSGANNPIGMGSAYFMVDQIGSVEFTGNMLYSEALKYVSIMRVTHDYGTAWDHINLYREGNAVYGTNGWKLYYDGTNAPTSYYPKKETYPQKQDSPLSEYDPANGIFKVSPAYDGYGSTLLY